MSSISNALQSVDDLMQFIDKMDIANADTNRNPSTEQTPQQQMQIPCDIAYRPVLPLGHTWYSWSHFNHTQLETSKPLSGPVITEITQEQASSPRPEITELVPDNESEQKEIQTEKEKDPSFKRRDHLLAIEQRVQAQWHSQRAFECTPDTREKYFVTFPYPYMNGYLHLGHAFTLSKAEFRAGYERLKGKNVLFPFAFHCTGMPIAAAALKIQEEMAMFGNPPQFPAVERDTHHKSKKKGKLQAKKSVHKFQWQIMKDFGLDDRQIAEFANPSTWLKFFPPIGMAHLKRFGLKTDWRRSFITTSANPFYSKFIEWQFNILKQSNKIVFGNRPTIFSPKDNQPCADHDRSEGENVNPQAYTLVKMQLITDTKLTQTPFIKSNGDKLAALYSLNKPIFLVAATLRPETVYGQTNCFVLPRGTYYAIEVCKKNDDKIIAGSEEIFICSEHSARNMSWQDMTPKQGEFSVLATIEGWDLLGRAVRAPYAAYEHVFIYPLLTIKMDKGTGIVTSVPSDAPADYAALKDAKKDAAFRKKYYLTDEMVLPFEVVDIIYIPKFDSNRSAVDLCEREKVRSQNDTNKLEDIKSRVYKYGFNFGTMIAGKFKGEKVSVAKVKTQQELIQDNLGTVYYEPESSVMSRTNSKCVVAFADQWFLKYGQENSPEWQRVVETHIRDNLECYNHVTKDQFIHVANWLQSWACSREFGLGTPLPWDTKWVIESLSDSTIYMAFYTIAHKLLGDESLDGLSGSAVDVNDIDHDVFDAIFLGKEVDFDARQNSVSNKLIRECRDSFEYWYPLDLRVSGKDLIFNHLTMSLYNHAAVWPGQAADRWPQSYFCNGHVMVDAEKMSKSTGTFITMVDACDKYSTDGTRFALADAGDSLDDANFDRSVANAAILDLTRLEMFVEEVYETMDALRDGSVPDSYNDLDLIFDNQVNKAVHDADEAYASMRFKNALTSGFHILERSRDYYRTHVEGGMHKQLMLKYVNMQLLVLSPICPHICEHLWQKINPKAGLIVNAQWPETPPASYELSQQFEYLQENSHLFRQAHHKAEEDRARKLRKVKDKTSDKYKQMSEPVSYACVCVADDYKPWQKVVIETLAKIYDRTSNSVRENYKQEVMMAMQAYHVREGIKLAKKERKSVVQEVMRFAAYLVVNLMPVRKHNTFDVQLAYDEFKFAVEHKQLLMHNIPVEIDNVLLFRESDENAPQFVRDRTMPGQPAIKYYSAGSQEITKLKEVKLK